MKSSMSKRLLSLMLSLLTLISCLTVFALPAQAAESALKFGISKTPCKGNLSQYSLPASCTSLTQGESAHLIFTATSDFYVDYARFYIKAPGQSSFTRVYNYDPSGYFRWCDYEYTFSKTGTYVFRVELRLTDGRTAAGETSISVTKKATTATTSNTYTLNGTKFNVVPNLKSQYCFNQKNYSRFVNKSGSNRGCTATAMCIAYSIYHNKVLSPNSVKWSSSGTSWEYCKRYTSSGKTYSGNTYTQSQALKAMYDCIAKENKPMVIGVNGFSSDHVVTVVGIRQGANRNKLSLADFLIVDPWGGKICKLNTYKSIDCGWALRVPIN